MKVGPLFQPRAWAPRLDGSLAGYRFPRSTGNIVVAVTDAKKRVAGNQDLSISDFASITPNQPFLPSSPKTPKRGAQPSSKRYPSRAPAIGFQLDEQVHPKATKIPPGAHNVIPTHLTECCGLDSTLSECHLNW